MRVLLLAVLAVAACTTPQSAEKVDVVWNRVDDTQTACQNLAGRKEIFAIRGCSRWGDTDRGGRRTCEIYAPEPRNERDLQAFATLGHELMHCFEGSWHDRWGRMEVPDRNAGVGASASPR